jgi:hypothetical protein
VQGSWKRPPSRASPCEEESLQLHRPIPKSLLLFGPGDDNEIDLQNGI